jgi:hypothetical protein
MSQKSELARPRGLRGSGGAGWIDLDVLRERVDLEAVAIALLGPHLVVEARAVAGGIGGTARFIKTATPRFA